MEAVLLSVVSSPVQVVITGAFRDALVGELVTGLDTDVVAVAGAPDRYLVGWLRRPMK